MKKTAILALLGSSLMFAQAVTSSTEKRQSTVTDEKLDGNRTKIVQHKSASQHTSDGYGGATSNSTSQTAVTKDKGNKKVKTTTGSSQSSSVTP